MAKKVDRTEEVTIKYDKDANKITVEGFSFKVVLTANQLQMINIYSGQEGVGKARISVQNATNVQEE